jgi:hypothetical protein
MTMVAFPTKRLDKPFCLMFKMDLKKIIWVSIFSVAMAYLESAVVVYLREIYYPEGFSFPLKYIPTNILIVEISREVATIIMLVSIGILSGKNFWEKFSYFMFSFGVWDIFYYIWLKIALNWPSSIFEWDVLFLIPIVWIGPVIAPVIISLSLIISALIILNFESKGYKFYATKKDWVLVIISGLIIILSFTVDLEYILNESLPQRFKWEIFAFGEILAIAVFYNRVANVKSNISQVATKT